MTFCLALLLLAAPASDLKSVAGVWQGKMHDQPGVTLTVKTEGDRLSGAVVFYVFRDEGDGPRIVGKDEFAMLNARFDGKTLTFDVETGDRKRVSFEMKIVSDGKGEIRRIGGGADEPKVIMIREKLILTAVSVWLNADC